MRSCYVYLVWDNVSEMVITAFVAVNDKLAKRQFDAMVEKNKIEEGDLSLYCLGGNPMPDNAEDVKSLIGSSVLKEVVSE